MNLRLHCIDWHLMWIKSWIKVYAESVDAWWLILNFNIPTKKGGTGTGVISELIFSSFICLSSLALAYSWILSIFLMICSYFTKCCSPLSDLDQLQGVCRVFKIKSHFNVGTQITSDPLIQVRYSVIKSRCPSLN